MTQIYLIRHGQAYCNVDKVLAGMNSDTGLTPFGVRQAERLRDRLTATGEIVADVLIASTLPRARQTAEILAPALGLPIIPDDDVQELRVGEADGLTWEQYITQFGPPPDFREAPFQPLFKGGENWAQFVLRVGTALHRIAQEYEGKTVVVVCHGGVIDASFIICLGMNMLALPPAQFHTRNTSITHWERYAYGEEHHWRLAGYNDDLHTRDLDAPERLGWVRLNAEPPAGSDAPAAPVPTEPTPEEAAASAAQ
ncbi:MAG: histidine phosphatase family protein [Ktedonobacterales bacterium]